MSTFEFVQVSAFLVLVCISLLLLHKIRRIHLVTYDLLTSSDANQLLAQIQSLLALDRLLGWRHPLPPLRGWAASPDFLLHVANYVLMSKPSCVVECSSGASTVAIAQALKLNGVGHVYSLEHDASYAAKTRDLLADHELSQWATVLDAPLASAATGTPWYSLDALPRDLPEIDVLVIDGPPAPIAAMARFPALPMLRPRMAPGFVVFADDTDRASDRQTVERWLRELPGLSVRWLQAEKGMAMISMAQPPATELQR